MPNQPGPTELLAQVQTLTLDMPKDLGSAPRLLCKELSSATSSNRKGTEEHGASLVLTQTSKPILPGHC